MLKMVNLRYVQGLYVYSKSKGVVFRLFEKS